MMTTGQLIWIATGVLFVAVVVWLLNRAINSGKKLPTPETKPYDTQDAPPPDSDSSGKHAS